jgi:hypothetical protein
VPRLENLIWKPMVRSGTRTTFEDKTSGALATEAGAVATEATLEGFAEDLGRLLGDAQNRAEDWIGQQNAIAERLVGIRDTATKLLAQLGIGDAPAPAKHRRKPNPRNMPPAPGQEVVKREPGRLAGSGKKKRTISPEARQNIASAQRARWAKWKKAVK